jgi:hypothetical protein
VEEGTAPARKNLFGGCLIVEEIQYKCATQRLLNSSNQDRVKKTLFRITLSTFSKQQDVIVANTICTADAEVKFAKGVRVVKYYLRYRHQPNIE